MKQVAINKKRRGKFLIPVEFFESFPNEMRMISSEIIVVRCEYLFAENSFIYHAYSEHFDEVEDGEVIPQYGFRFSENGIVSMVVYRMDK